MDKNVSDFVSGFTNVCEGKFTIGREKNSNGMEFIIISNDGKEFYKFWNNPKKILTNKPPKHTGGKPSYVKMMVDEVNKHPELSLNASGLIIKMIPNIQWGDNLLVNVRSKKPLLIDDMSRILDISDKTTRTALKELKSAGLLTKDKDGYKVSPNLIQKGGAIKNGL